MKDNIYDLAKVISEAPYGRVYSHMKQAGFGGLSKVEMMRDLAEALLAVWDGKASTLDQAAAWRKVRDYLNTAGLLSRPSLLPGNSDLDQVMNCIGELRRNAAIAMTTSVRIEAPTEWDPAALERLLKDVHEYPGEGVRPLSGTLRRGQALHGSSLVWMTPAERIRKPADAGECLLHADFASLEAKVHAWINCPGHSVSPKEPKAIGKMIDKRGKGKAEDYEIQSVIGGTEDKWVVLDMDGTVRHPHCKAWALQLYASEHPFGCPCDNCCRPMGGVPISRTGDPIEPANDNQPDQGSTSYPHLMRRKDSGVWFSVGNVKSVDGGWTVDNEFGDRARFVPSEGYELTLYAGEGSDDLSLDMAEALRTLAAVVEPARIDVMRRLLVVQDTCYGLAERAGWWTDLETGEDVRSWPKKHLDNWVSAKLMLTVTEVAEAMEGHRKGLVDDKLPNRPMLEVELADAVIRIMDLAGGLNLDVAGAIVEKLAYNMTRADHKPENRKAAGGKSV